MSFSAFTSFREVWSSMIWKIVNCPFTFLGYCITHIHCQTTYSLFSTSSELTKPSHQWFTIVEGVARFLYLFVDRQLGFARFWCLSQKGIQATLWTIFISLIILIVLANDIRHWQVQWVWTNFVVSCHWSIFADKQTQKSFINVLRQPIF